MIKLIFLGTKGEIEEQTKKHKYHSSFLLEYNNFRLLIDYGTLQKNSLRKINPKAILITHAHPDHYVWTKENLETDIPIYLTKQTYDYGKFKPKNFKIITPNKKIKFNKFTILPYSVMHSIKCPAIGFKIYIKNKSIIYIGDVVDIISKNKILKNTDIYIGDGSSIKANLIRKRGNNFFGHAQISTQIKWCEKAGIKKIIFTHLGKETLRKENQFKKQNPQIIFAYDGMKMKV